VLSDPSDHEDQYTHPQSLLSSDHADPLDTEDWWDLDDMGEDEEEDDEPTPSISQLEAFEEELDDITDAGVDKERSWETMLSELDKILKTSFNTLGCSDYTQFLILKNFVMLLVKGLSMMEASKLVADQWHKGSGVHFAQRVRALARHYCTFGRIIGEGRGGACAGSSAHGTSLLLNENVEAACRAWLTSCKSGTVTPVKFAQALDDTILPNLGITPLTPLVPRTAQRWLIRLGWQHSTVRKGVYKDGHDREDVVKYRDEKFLPEMKKLETRMATSGDDPTAPLIPPTLQEGEKRLYTYFHDECCMHANDAVGSVW
jgi:hypothetical protein